MATSDRPSSNGGSTAGWRAILYILREEMNEYRHAIGDDLEPWRASEVIGRSLVAGLFYAFVTWLMDNELDHWWDIAEWIFLAVALLLWLWRWLNDPPDGQSPDEDPDVAELLSRDSGLGFAGAVLVVCVIMFGVFWFF